MRHSSQAQLQSHSGLSPFAGMWFFQRWARFIFVAVLVIALVTSPFRVHRYSLSTPPSFVPFIATIMLLVTVTIAVMSFLPPIRQCFATQEA